MANLLFDLDETLVGGDMISSTSSELLKNGVIDRQYTNKDSHHYDLRNLPDLVRVRTIQRFSDPEYVWYKHPIPGAYYLLRFLELSAHRLGIVTARPIVLRTETVKFIRARFPAIEFDLGINFVNNTETVGDKEMPSKVCFLEKNKPDYYFDDNAEYCTQAKSLGIKTYLISNKHTPWNHEFAKQQLALPDPVKVLRNIAFFPETSAYNGYNQFESQS